MTTANDARKAHKLLDYVSQGRAVLDDELKLLRSFLPDLPKQKTLAELAELVNEAWGFTHINEWDDDAYGSLESWLSDIEMQLRGLADAKPAHPEFLETEADYASAPEGTIVACEDSPPCHKFGSEWSSVLFYGVKDDRGMSRACRRVLRWRWGE